MKPEITVDYRLFQKAARELQATSSRSMVDFINGQALKVAIESVRRTKKTDPSRIQWQLGATPRQGPFFRQLTRGKNKGKWRQSNGGFVIKEDSLARRILGWRMANQGSFGVRGKTDEEREKNLIRYRMRSKGFIASGWIHARNALFSIVKQKPANLKSVGDAKAVGKKKGSASPARFQVRGIIQAIISNTALLSQSRKPSEPRSPMAVAIKGLQEALDETARNMINELERRLKKDLKV